MIPSKKTKKEEAQPLAAVDASTSSGLSNLPSFDNIIDEPEEKVKPPKSKKAKLPKNLGGLTMESKVPDLFIKIYEEQLPDGLDKFLEGVKVIDKTDYWVLTIIHDRDLDGDEVFEPACNKRHIHIIIVKKGKDKYGRAERRKVSTMLALLGVVFRPELDELIWRERGVERIKTLEQAVAYLTHETPECDVKGKELYDRDDIVSNLEPDEIDQLRDGYVRISHSKHKATIDEQIEFADEAYKCGLSGAKSFEEFELGLPFVLQKGSVYQLYRKRYQQGVERRMEDRTDILRLSVFIKGEANQGKTYAAKHAFDELGLRVLKIGDGGKTGKFDSLTDAHDVLILDDAICHDLLGVADNNAVKAYRRNGENPYWCGEYFIVTSNPSFEDWAKRCGVDDYTMNAAKSRFYICEIVEQGDGRKFLHVPADCISKRGTPDEQEIRRDRFIEFRKRFEKIINEYRPDAREVDYSMI